MYTHTHTHTPSRGAVDAFRVEGGERRGGLERGEGRRESEARRYLGRIILHYVPKRRTNAVLIYASPRGDKRKAGEIGVSRAGNQLFCVEVGGRFATGMPRTMLELLSLVVSSRGIIFSLRFLFASSINNSRFR